MNPPMDNHNPGASLSGTGERSPFTDPTNAPVNVHGNENPTCQNLREKKNSKGAQSWYARLSDEKRAEYHQKRHTLYKEKKAAAKKTANHEQVSQAPASSLMGVQRTPLSNITNTLDDGICTAATSVSTNHQTEDMSVRCKKRTVTTVPDTKVGTTILESLCRPSFMCSAICDVLQVEVEDHNPGASPSATGERSSTNTPVHVHGNENSKGAQGWYARLSEEGRYLVWS
ncbi:uncharacterized protein [Triticum aestivum]|uniref:uncharacterized protein n=1 Tax=Triticum aestivum TaxID=4565 RepID=UPI001D01C5C6|nr:uncharacterized protein LOC123050588 [Triticum aestivum]